MIKIVVKALNYLLPKNRKSIVLTPHSNCSIDHYDIFNWESDNVLCFFRYIVDNANYAGFTIYLVYYDDSKLQQYLEFARKYRDRRIVFVKDNTIAFIWGFLNSRIIINATTYRTYSYKVSSQKCICLGYYTPFKNDFEHIIELGEKGQKRYFKKINHLFDYHITTSDFSSRIIASDFLLKYNKMLPLGFPRNDIFYRNNDNRRKETISFISQYCGTIVNRLILYTPTFRDYESVHDNNRSLWGNMSEVCEKELNSFLKETGTVVVAKLHPLQEASIINSPDCSNIILYSNLFKKRQFNLYELLSVSDLLITDYTSTCFDYMHKGNPIIYYWYDYDKYLNIRGFCINPVNDLCKGKIVHTPEELINAVKFAFKCDCSQDEAQGTSHDIMNLFYDGNSTKRVSDLVLSLTKD